MRVVIAGGHGTTALLHADRPARRILELASGGIPISQAIARLAE